MHWILDICRYEGCKKNWLDRKVSIIAVYSSPLLFIKKCQGCCIQGRGDHKVEWVFHNLCSPQLWLEDWIRCRSLQCRYSDNRPILFLLLSAFLSSKVGSIHFTYRNRTLCIFLCTWSVHEEIVLFYHHSFIWSLSQISPLLLICSYHYCRLLQSHQQV